jgi:lipoprotein-releasing system permease protein
VSIRLVAFAALRYFRSRRQGSGAAARILSVLGIAVGVMTLTAVLGVMNGFQLGFIENILEISSYHLQVQRTDGQPLEPELLRRLALLPMVRAVVPFSEQQVIVQSRYLGGRGCLLRGLPAEVSDLDPGFRAHMTMVEGALELADPQDMVLGVELARQLGVEVGDTVSVLALGGVSFNNLAPESRQYRIRGLFRSGYYEFDLGWALVRLAASPASEAGEAQIRYGIKIRNRFHDEAALRAVAAVLGPGPYRVGSWREFSRAFFAALRMEKLLMMILVGLIFVVVGFNIYHSLRRSVRERYEEIGVLKALGASQDAVEYIFVSEGFLIGLLGGGLGLALGLLLASNINAVFRAAEALVNLVLELASRLVVPLAGGDRFALFSPTYFYLSEVPSRVLLPEAFLVVLFALGSCVLAALFAAVPVRRVLPAEVLRYE